MCLNVDYNGDRSMEFVDAFYSKKNNTVLLFYFLVTTCHRNLKFD